MITREKMIRLGWRGWLYALGKAVIGGGANGVTTAIVVPLVDSSFIAGSREWFVLVGWTFATSATLALFYYLAKSPLPDINP